LQIKAGLGSLAIFKETGFQDELSLKEYHFIHIILPMIIVTKKGE